MAGPGVEGDGDAKVGVHSICIAGLREQCVESVPQ